MNISMKIDMRKHIIAQAVLLAGLLISVTVLIAHTSPQFKNKSYGFNNYADTFSLSLNNDNVIGVNRNGKSIFQEKNFCELRGEPIPHQP